MTRGPSDHDISAGGELDDVRVSLRVVGDDLDPSYVTSLLGVPPTLARRKGDPPVPGHQRGPAPTGVWALDLQASKEWQLGDAILALLAKVPADPSAWATLGQRYRLDVFCGLFLDAWNRGITLDPSVLDALASRGLTLDLDVYSAGDLDV